MSKLLSIKEVSELLALKPATIRSWLYRRRLPWVRCGRSIRVPLEAITEFIQRNTVPAKEQQR